MTKMPDHITDDGYYKSQEYKLESRSSRLDALIDHYELHPSDWLDVMNEREKYNLLEAILVNDSLGGGEIRDIISRERQRRAENQLEIEP